jgi:hypothetical protein
MDTKFTHDNKEIKVGQDVRAIYRIDEQRTLYVILTNEGIIYDVYEGGECISTSCRMYDEVAFEMTEELD